MACCGKRLPPDNILDFAWLGCPCDTWAHMKDQFQYLKDERAGVIPCKPGQFTVQWSTIDVMTLLIAVTDNLTGEVCEYSVVREYTFESPEQAFVRDYREKEIRHNRGIKRAVDDTLEAFEELNPTIKYKLSEENKGFYIHRPIRKDLGVVAWKTIYGVGRHDRPFEYTEWWDFVPDSVIELPPVTPEIGAALMLLIKRMRKVGVKFEGVTYKTVDDLNIIEVTGLAYRDQFTFSTIKIVYQEMDLTREALNAYHEYYTPKGPQDGYYNC